MDIQPARGKLAVLLPGLGAVATTFIAGVMLARRGIGVPVGSLSQLGTIRLGKRDEAKTPKISDALPIAKLDQLEFGAWDLFEDDAYASAKHANVLKPEHLEAIKEELLQIKPMKAVFYPEFVKRLHGTHVKTGPTKADMVEQLRADIRNFIRDKGCDRAVAVWCGSTEIYTEPTAPHATIKTFERALVDSHPAITNSQMYAWALLKEKVPFANGSPNVALDFPAARELARLNEVPICGKDFKTGQTLMKTIIAPGLKARMIGIRGWYSTNILGNRDGEVLDDPDSFRAKEVSKLGVLESVLKPKEHPELYGNITHKIRIDYYPPRGDDKEGWDNIDIFGWMGYPMQMKIDFLCRDSILAAPIVLDLALFIDLAHRAGMRDTQEWLGFYFKSPMALTEREPDHDLFLQLKTLKNTLRWMLGGEAINELGADYYE